MVGSAPGEETDYILTNVLLHYNNKLFQRKVHFGGLYNLFPLLAYSFAVKRELTLNRLFFWFFRNKNKKMI